MKTRISICLFLSFVLHIQAISAEQPKFNTSQSSTISLPPMMGWSSWNTFALAIDEDLIKAQADAMVQKGLKSVGYTYINTDDGYFGGRDSIDGHLLVHPVKFPHGLTSLVDYIHSKGLKAGIYTDAGGNTCGAIWAGNKSGEGCGLYGHDAQDISLFFNDYHFDFLKVDYCGGYKMQATGEICRASNRYTAIRHTIDSIASKSVRMNVCTGAFPGAWAGEIADSWRTTGDIDCSWSSISSIINQNLYLSAYSLPGHYNDMDMLEVGRGLTVEEDKTHFGLWCIMNSPLMIGCDLRTLNDETLALITNPELIALNQDLLFQQAYVATYADSCYILVKDLQKAHSGIRAVAVYNPTEREATATLRFADVDLQGKVKVRDLFQRKDLGKKRESFSFSIPSHGTRIFRIEGHQHERSRYEAETGLIPTYQTMYSTKGYQMARYEYDSSCSGNLKVSHLGNHADNKLQWNNVWSKRGGSYRLTFRVKSEVESKMAIKVNGCYVGEILVQGSPSWQEVSINVKLCRGNNNIELTNPQSSMPSVDWMQVSN